MSANIAAIHRSAFSAESAGPDDLITVMNMIPMMIKKIIIVTFEIMVVLWLGKCAGVGVIVSVRL